LRLRGELLSPVRLLEDEEEEAEEEEEEEEEELELLREKGNDLDR
jgi:hypothetical protein